MIKLLQRSGFFMGKIAKKIWFAVTILSILFFAIVCFETPFVSILSMPDVINLNTEDIENINNFEQFGRFVKLSTVGDLQASVGGNFDCEVNVKLFNLFTIKTLKVNTENIDLYVGGDIVGFSLNSDGVIVISSSCVAGNDGDVNTIKDSDIKKGDTIKQIENQKIKSVADIIKVSNMDENKDKTLKMILQRGEEEISTTIKNVYDKNSRLFKLGLWVKDDVSGIGTLTYIKKDDGRFGALGHAICDNDTKTVFNAKSGEMHKCSVIGVKKGAKGKAGELKGMFFQDKNTLGEVDKNCDCGVFGTCSENSNITTGKDLLKAGGRMYAKPGSAIIRASLDGKTIKDYKIEIVKTNYQSTKNEKSMVIRVVDKELLEKTGGIIQGMSGSPIIQNGRIVGAVTHVFINDPSKGFGIYLDWMINQ